MWQCTVSGENDIPYARSDWQLNSHPTAIVDKAIETFGGKAEFALVLSGN